MHIIESKVFDELAAEKNRLREEVSNAIREVPGLRSQVEALAGDVDGYANTWLDTVERFALRMGASGQSPVEVFQRITLDSLRAARRENMTPEQVFEEDLTELAPTQPAEEASAASAPAANGPLAHIGVESIDDLYTLAAEALPGFQESISGIAEATGGTAHFRPGNGLKTRARIERKIEQDYPEEGAKRVLDVLGGTILYASRADVEAALPAIEQRIQDGGGEVARIKNRFDKPSAGYKDYLLNIRMPNGMVTELLLATKTMSEAKNGETGVGHDLYEAMQTAEAALNDEGSTNEEKAEAWWYLAQLKRASESYYGSTGEESSETASLSGIVEPLYMMSATGALPNANSKLYPKLEPFLARIRKRPELAMAYGTSSYSTNSRMNTGSLSVPISQGVPSEASRPSLNNVRTAPEESNSFQGGIKPIAEPPANTHNVTSSEGNGNIGSGRLIGAKTSILGKGVADAARYEVWELDDVIPSHDPENGFARREDYPATAQERPYHSDTGEQEKVRGNALSYLPALVVNSDPTAGNGPPIITREGIVLGGNSRVMTLQLVYADRPDSAAAYRQTLTSQAAGFGIEPVALEGMRRPILVRVVDGHMTPEEMAVKSRRYNQTTTQKLQAKAEGVSRARMISPTTLAALSADMADFDTLRQFLDSPRSKGFVRLLLQDGVIEQTEISSLTEKGGRLNDSGKKLVEDALRGMVVADYDVLEALPASVLNKLDRTIPALARLKARGEGWDLGHALTAALRIVGKAAAEGRKVEGWLGQGDLLDTDPEKKRPAVQALALTFANATQKEVAARIVYFFQ